MTEPDPPSSEPSAVGGQDDIELRLGASLIHLPVIRSVAASIAIRADLDLDSIADLRLAVDEACSTLITRAVPESTMVCRFTLADDEFRFTGTVASDSREAPSTGTFGWRVLTTLADSADVWLEPAARDGDGDRVHIELTKRKPILT